MVAALPANRPAGGWVESVVTFATHLRFWLSPLFALLAILLRVFLPAGMEPPSVNTLFI
jgi:hypothetical protein